MRKLRVEPKLGSCFQPQQIRWYSDINVYVAGGCCAFCASSITCRSFGQLAGSLPARLPAHLSKRPYGCLLEGLVLITTWENRRRTSATFTTVLQRSKVDMCCCSLSSCSMPFLPLLVLTRLAGSKCFQAFANWYLHM